MHAPSKETVIITHHNADLDALASLIGATVLYPGARALSGRSLSPPVRKYLALHKDHFDLVPYHKVDPTSVQRVIIVDVRDRRRLKEYEPILQQPGLEIVVFDHHPASAHDVQTDQAWVEPTGSCATLMAERIKDHGGLELNAATATLLLLGIYADTGKLCFDSTTPRDVDAAAYLLRQGANLRVITRYLSEEFSPEQQQLLVGMLAETKEVSINAVEVAISQGKAPRFVRGAAFVVGRIMNIGGHDAIFGVIEFTKDKRVQLIGRSRVPYIHMGELLKPFGGGGHAGAGAATVKGGDLAHIITQLEDALKHANLSPTRVSDLMSAPVQTIRHDASLTELARLLERWNISGVPVLKNDELCGVISVRDIAKAREKNLMHSPVSAFMSNELKTIAHDEPVEDALDLMTKEDIGRLPVMHENRIIGILSRTDVLARLYALPDPA